MSIIKRAGEAVHDAITQLGGVEGAGTPDYEAVAIAVIKALRDPSEGMISAGSDAETVDCYSIGFGTSEQCYQLMIDAALKEAD